MLKSLNSRMCVTLATPNPGTLLIARQGPTTKVCATSRHLRNVRYMTRMLSRGIIRQSMLGGIPLDITSDKGKTLPEGE